MGTGQATNVRPTSTPGKPQAAPARPSRSRLPLQHEPAPAPPPPRPSAVHALPHPGRRPCGPPPTGGCSRAQPAASVRRAGQPAAARPIWPVRQRQPAYGQHHTRRGGTAHPGLQAAHSTRRGRHHVRHAPRPGRPRPRGPTTPTRGRPGDPVQLPRRHRKQPSSMALSRRRAPAQAWQADDRTGLVAPHLPTGRSVQGLQQHLRQPLHGVPEPAAAPSPKPARLRARRRLPPARPHSPAPDREGSTRARRPHNRLRGHHERFRHSRARGAAHRLSRLQRPGSHPEHHPGRLHRHLDAPTRRRRGRARARSQARRPPGTDPIRHCHRPSPPRSSGR